MTDYLEFACEYHGVDKGKVIKHRQQVGPDGGDAYSVIVDYGIMGCKKYYVPLSELDELAQLSDLPVPAAIDLNYRELQDLAKEQGIPANQKHIDLVNALFAKDEEE